MIRFLVSLLLWSLRALLKSGGTLVVENLTLRQQLAAYARCQKRCPRAAPRANVLGNAVQSVGQLAISSDNRQACDRNRLASGDTGDGVLADQCHDYPAVYLHGHRVPIFVMCVRRNGGNEDFISAACQYGFPALHESGRRHAYSKHDYSRFVPKPSVAVSRSECTG